MSSSQPSPKAQRNAGLEFLRFIAALAVFLHHMSYCSAGSRAVPFFFLLSGYFMAKSLARTSDETGMTSSGNTTTLCQFMIKKLRVFYPELIVSVFLAFSVAVARIAANHECGVLPDLLMDTLVNDVCLLRMSGILDPIAGVCPPDWYLSSMLIGMLLLFPIFRTKCRVLLFFLTFASSQSFYLYLNQFYNPSRLLQWNFFIPDGMFQGLSMLSAGAIIYWISETEGITRCFRNYRRIVGIFQYSLLALAMATLFERDFLNDTLSWVLWGMYLMCVFGLRGHQAVNNSGFTKQAMLYLGKISLPLYLSHWPTVFVSGKIGCSFSIIDCAWSMLALKCLLCAIFTWAVMYGAKKLRQLGRRIPCWYAG